jgi:uncharacterized membrane protein YeaQ/YmgE (transglycosylase-associated protein family)
MTIDTLLAYMAIGLCAALAAMMWPFRRGAIGLLVEIGAGVGGAVGLAAASYAFFPASSPVHLLFATVGAITVLLTTHGLWLWNAARTQRAHQESHARPVHR